MSFTCFKCAKDFASFEVLTLHFRVHHNLSANDRYICYKGGCQREFSMLKQFRRDVYRDHKELLNSVTYTEQNNGVVVCESDDQQMTRCSSHAIGDSSNNSYALDHLPLIDLSAASFVAKLKSNSASPASAVSEILSSVDEFLVEGCIKHLQQITISVLARNNIDS